MSKGALGLLSAYWPERTARHAHVPLERVSQFCVHRPAGSEPDRAALASPARTLTYAELSTLVRTVAQGVAERVGDGGRVAIVTPDPVETAVAALGCLEADRLVFVAGGPVAPRVLDAFAADLVIGPAGGTAPAGTPTVDAAELMGGPPPAGSPPRPNLRQPILALPRPWGGEVLHNHKTLVATAVSFGSFYMLEPGAELVCFEPPASWLGLAALLGTWHRGATFRPAWGEEWAGHPDRVDYLVAGWEAAEARYLGSAPTLRDVQAGVGAIVGLTRPFSPARRRRLSRRLRTPVFTLFGRNDLGPVIGTHPTWSLDDAAGIPMPNVELKPLHPGDGSELTIGWDAVEEGDVGVKSTMSPAGGVLSGSWLRGFVTAVVDPTGMYFLRDELPMPAPGGP